MVCDFIILLHHHWHTYNYGKNRFFFNSPTGDNAPRLFNDYFNSHMYYQKFILKMGRRLGMYCRALLATVNWRGGGGGGAYCWALLVTVKKIQILKKILRLLMIHARKKPVIFGLIIYCNLNHNYWRSIALDMNRTSGRFLHRNF